jgi:L-ascorbate metabolism protein UlaG (beta-lactamase superfamily)
MFAQRQAVDIPADHVIHPSRAYQTFQQTARQETITWLGHACFLLRLQGKHILTDPFLSDTAGPLPGGGPKRFVPPGLPVDRLPRIDLILLSHGHYDHLDKETLQALPNKQSIDVIVPLGLGNIMRQLGYTRVYELDWFQRIAFYGIEWTALPAVHFSRRGLLDTNKTLWASYSIQTPNQHIFFGGDTAYGKVFHEIGATVGPFDVALIGIGAYAPRRIMRPVHAAPEEAIQIGMDIRAHHIVAMHWGTIRLTTEPPFDPPERFKQAAFEAGIPEERCWVMKIGETRVLPTN